MQYKRTLWAFTFIFLLAGCAADNVLTKEELSNQNKADSIVAGVLFDKDLDASSSYNIRKNGSVIIKFDESVSEKQYTEVVEFLRASPDIKSVRAEQSGIEVCPLKF